MRTQPIARAVSVTLNGSGTGIASTGPAITNEIWTPTSVSISCTGNQPTPTAPAIATCSIYAGSGIGNSTFVDATYQVLGASSSMISGQLIYVGQLIYAVWENCNPGEVATLTVYGTRAVP
jgi:hypothetical protein